MHGEMEIVNIIGVGNVHEKMPIKEFQKLFPLGKPDPYGARFIIRYGGFSIRNRGTITLFSSGKYLISGAKSFHALARIQIKVFSTLLRAGFTFKNVPIFKISNVVRLGSLGFPINLDVAAMILPGNCEYDPEQFPGIIYRPGGLDFSATVLLYTNGSFIITGTPYEEKAHKVIEKIARELEDLNLVGDIFN